MYQGYLQPCYWNLKSYRCLETGLQSLQPVDPLCSPGICVFVFADEDEARLALPNMPQNLKCVSSKQVSVPPMEPHVHEVLCDLLNALTVVMVTKEGG